MRPVVSVGAAGGCCLHVGGRGGQQSRGSGPARLGLLGPTLPGRAGLGLPCLFPRILLGRGWGPGRGGKKCERLVVGWGLRFVC